MSTFEAKYHGRTAWIATPMPVQVAQKCPECVGDRRITVTLGNGESFRVECALCRGKGAIEPLCYVSHPEEVTCMLHEIRPERPPVYHVGGSRILPETEIFETEAEAQAEAERRMAERRESERARLLHSMLTNREKYAWSVHYWRRQRSDRVQEIELIDERIQEIKKRNEP